MPVKRRTKQVRFAVVGLGNISQGSLLPGFHNARRNSRLAALVSGNASKRRALGKTYGVATYSYRQYDALLASGEVDAVYIGLPNHLHLDYALRAARHGVHVFCEKPLALTERECRAMIAACKRGGVKLMTAYRLHLDRGTIAAIDLVRGGSIGEPRLFTSSFSFRVKPPNVRLMASEDGGGPLYDIGVYCINAARHLMGAEPIEVYAATEGGHRRGWLCEESASCVLRFPRGRLAAFSVSFGASYTGDYRVVGTKGVLRVAPGYSYGRERELQLSTGGKRRQLSFAHGDQFGAQLLHFSDCILRDRQPGPSGEEGLADVRIVRALLKSAATGRAVKLAPRRARPAPPSSQAITCPPAKAVRLVIAKRPG